MYTVRMIILKFALLSILLFQHPGIQARHAPEEQLPIGSNQWTAIAGNYGEHHGPSVLLSRLQSGNPGGNPSSPSDVNNGGTPSSNAPASDASTLSGNRLTVEGKNRAPPGFDKTLLSNLQSNMNNVTPAFPSAPNSNRLTVRDKRKTPAFEKTLLSRLQGGTPTVPSNGNNVIPPSTNAPLIPAPNLFGNRLTVERKSRAPPAFDKTLLSSLQAGNPSGPSSADLHPSEPSPISDGNQSGNDAPVASTIVGNRLTVEVNRKSRAPPAFDKLLMSNLQSGLSTSPSPGGNKGSPSNNGAPNSNRLTVQDKRRSPAFQKTLLSSLQGGTISSPSHDNNQAPGANVNTNRLTVEDQRKSRAPLPYEKTFLSSLQGEHSTFSSHGGNRLPVDDERKTRAPPAYENILLISLQGGTPSGPSTGNHFTADGRRQDRSPPAVDNSVPTRSTTGSFGDDEALGASPASYNSNTMSSNLQDGTPYTSSNDGHLRQADGKRIRAPPADADFSQRHGHQDGSSHNFGAVENVKKRDQSVPSRTCVLNGFDTDLGSANATFLSTLIDHLLPWTGHKSSTDSLDKKVGCSDSTYNFNSITDQFTSSLQHMSVAFG